VALENGLATQRPSLRGLIEKTRNTWHASQGDYDFSHEVKEAMSGCLACKACSTQCPIKIDVPGFRSRFLQLYHTRYHRPLRDY
ncbi:4Fe-4S dicluster domain-containing protein, partial [Salmonella enterica]